MLDLRIAFGALAITAALALGGCVTPGDKDWRASPRFGEGRTYALRYCAGCHAVEEAGPSRDPVAPPFRTLSARFPASALRKRLDAVAEHGHWNMPPIYIVPAERRAIETYIRGLPAAAAARKTTL